MKPHNMARLVEELATEYSGAATAKEAEKTLVRLPKIYFPDRCEPGTTSALVILDLQQAVPQFLLKEIPTLPGGKSPRSVSATAIAGEAWYSFSFSQPWDEDTHSAVQFVEGRLRRFALNE